MRRAFCFSRSWSRYSPSLPRPRPCWPGGYGRISMGHLGDSHLLPLRNSFIFSRRQRLQSAPVYRAIDQTLRRCAEWLLRAFANIRSTPPSLWWPAPVVRNWRHVLDRAHLEPGGLQRTDRGLPARAGALHEHVHLAHAVLLRLARGRLGGKLRGERRRLAGALEADVP